jgi:flagellar protein FliL
MPSNYRSVLRRNALSPTLPAPARARISGPAPAFTPRETSREKTSMRDDAQNTETTEEPAAAPRKAGMLLLILVLLAGIGAGAGVGFLVVGPRFAPKAAHAAEAGEKHGKKKGGGGHGGEEKPAAHTFDNVVVNPAGSNGTRFLIAAIALEVEEGDEGKLVAADAAIRDAIAHTLATHTVAELTALHARDSVKVRLARRIEEAAHVKVTRIYLPQYVLQ